MAPPRRGLRAVVSLLVAAVTLWVLGQQFVTDGPWWLELSRFLPFPLWLAPALTALALSLGLGAAWRSAAIACVVLVVTLGMGLAWHPPRPAAGAIRLMTWNAKAHLAVARTGGVEALAKEIAAHDPDVVVMQDAGALETLHPAGREAPLFGLPHVVIEGQYVVASRLPLSGCRQASAPTASGEPIDYLRCTVDAHGTPFELLTVHFGSPRLGLNAARREGAEGIEEWRRNERGRLAQAIAMARVTAGLRGAHVIAGDLNAAEPSAVVQSLLATGLRDAFSAAGRGYGFTYGHTLRPAFSFLRIDHVLASPEVDVVDCRTGGAGASDHRPVIADLVISR